VGSGTLVANLGKGFVASLLILSAIGCSAGGDVSDTDMAKARSEMSQEKYEEAMRAAGKGAELDREKAAAASRGEDR
jgi:hypothetical protein